MEKSFKYLIFRSERVIITVPVHIKKMHHTKTIYKIIEKPVPMATSHFSDGFQTLGTAEGTPGAYGYGGSDGGYSHGGAGDAVYNQVNNGDNTDPQGELHPGHGHIIQRGHESNHHGPTGTDPYKVMPSTGHHYGAPSHEINGVLPNPAYVPNEYRDRGHRGDFNARGLVHDDELRHGHRASGGDGHQVRFGSHNRGSYQPDSGGIDGSGKTAARHLSYPTVTANKYVPVGESQHRHRGGPYRVYVQRGNVGVVRHVGGPSVGEHFGDRSRGHHFGTAAVHVGKLKHGHVGGSWRGREIPGPVVRRPHEHRHLVGYGFQGYDHPQHGNRSPPGGYAVPEQNGYDDKNYHGHGGSGGGGEGGSGGDGVPYGYPAGHTEHNDGGGGDYGYTGYSGHNGGGDLASYNPGYAGQNTDHKYSGHVGNSGGGGYGDRNKYPGYVAHSSGGGYQVQENVVDYDGQTVASSEPPRPAHNAYTPSVSAVHDTSAVGGVRGGRDDPLDGMSSVFAASPPHVVKNVYYTLDPIVPYDDVSPLSPKSHRA